MYTGDALLFSSNTSTGFFLKTFTSSMWNHSGIAIRIDSRGNIRLDNKGRLYVLEINTWERVDAITGEKVVGAGYSDYDWVKARYNIIAVRQLKPEYRRRCIISRISNYVNKNRGCKFSTEMEPFLSVWLGIELTDDTREDSMFCSEFMYYFYSYILRFKPDHSTILGKCVIKPRLCAPKHFSTEFSPDSTIFLSSDHILYIQYSDFLPSVLSVLIISFFLLTIIWMSLSSRRR